MARAGSAVATPEPDAMALHKTMTETAEIRTHAMLWTWRACLAALPLLGLVALVLAGGELAGLVPRGAWLGAATDGERGAAVAFGALVQPFGWTALRHARLTIDRHDLRCLAFGFVCRTVRVPFAEVRRWGHAVGRNRGRREPLLLFELRDGTTQLVKLARHAGPAAVRRTVADALSRA